MFIDVFQMRGEPTRHCLLCKPSMETPAVCIRRCIPEAKGIVPLLQALFTITTPRETSTICVRRCIPNVMPITQCQVPEGITNGMQITMHC